MNEIDATVTIGPALRQIAFAAATLLWAAPALGYLISLVIGRIVGEW